MRIYVGETCCGWESAKRLSFFFQTKRIEHLFTFLTRIDSAAVIVDVVLHFCVQQCSGASQEYVKIVPLLFHLIIARKAFPLVDKTKKVSAQAFPDVTPQIILK